MATLKQRLHRKTDSGSYDVVHLETSADIVAYDENYSIKDIIDSVSDTASAAYNEIPSLKSSVSEGKKQVASAITDRGVSTASDASFSTMATNIRKIDKVISGTPTLNKDFTYTGTCQVLDDSTESSNEWRIKFLTSGVLKFTAKVAVDLFLVGGGGGGAGYALNSGSYPSGGGGGGYTKSLSNISLAANTSYTITIGDGGAAGEKSVAGNSNGNNGGNGGSTTISSISNGSVNGGNGGNDGSHSHSYAIDGGNGGSGGGAGCSMATRVTTYTRSTRATNGANGGKCGIASGTGSIVSFGTVGTGQGTTTREFGDPAATLYSTGGASGGVGDPNSPIANSGNGGDGRATGGNSAGSSGILVIRKHKT